MTDVNLDALEQTLRDFYGELESLAFTEVQDDPEYQKLVTQIKQVMVSDPIVTYLHEGDRRAAGHTITEENLQTFRQYYDFIHERENFVFQKVFAYGFVIGSKLLDGEDIRNRKKK